MEDVGSNPARDKTLHLDAFYCGNVKICTHWMNIGVEDMHWQADLCKNN